MRNAANAGFSHELTIAKEYSRLLGFEYPYPWSYRARICQNALILLARAATKAMAENPGQG